MSVMLAFEDQRAKGWYTPYPRGRALHVLSGVCQIQLCGAPLQEVASGDSVWIDAGEIHGHGAAPRRNLVHFAIQETDDNGVEVVWMEHVGEQQRTIS